VGLHRVTKVPEHLVNVFLLWPELPTRSLKLDEERSAAWDEEHPVGPAGLPLDIELEVTHPELQCFATDLLLDR